MIPVKKFARLSRKNQVRWLLRSLPELAQSSALLEPAQLRAFYVQYLEGLVEEQLRLGRALEAQWERWCGSFDKADAVGAAERRELEELLKQLCGIEPSDWSSDDAMNIDGMGANEGLVAGEEGAETGSTADLVLYLDRVRSPFNVGSVFRSAAAFGVREIWLHRHCPDLEHPRARRAAMGCIEWLPARRSNVPQDEPDLKGLPWLGLETRDVVTQYLGPKFGGADNGKMSVPGEYRFPGTGGLLLVGAEESGLRPELLEYCAGAENRRLGGGLLSIPTPGIKQSLNLGVAAAIVLQRWSEVIFSEKS
ncbi:TrmH family RNA methyltransferase [Candidatus Haliotispira prima]|uniref:TrmH family RNA methyltransferase n=1 Tax=Candidatus Haliotispira prima TaxID=3034016 RepID=A0ABY8MFI9_9SPIO|nr:TrmH family RNA methyltransferase [Candidatus Haliotispira prima]